MVLKRKVGDQRRTEWLTIRMTYNTKMMVRSAARRQGKTITKYIIDLVRMDLGKPIYDTYTYGDYGGEYGDEV